MDDLNHQRSVPEYNTRAVVNRTGVSADTFRAWERRHGLPVPARTGSNHRLYSERDIAIISNLKHMTTKGVLISHAVDKIRRELNSHPSHPLASESSKSTTPSSLETTRSAIMSAISVLDTRRANDLIEDALAVIDLDLLCQRVLQPILVELGDRWRHGEAVISMEHYGSAFMMRKLSALFDASQPESGDPTVLCSCVEGEHHDIGLMMISLMLSRSGYRVVYLGSNLPTSNLVSAVQSIRPDAIALSSTTRATLPALIDAVSAVRDDCTSCPCPVIGFGGSLFEREPEHRHTVDARYLGTDARVASQRLDELMTLRANMAAV